MTTKILCNIGLQRKREELHISSFFLGPMGYIKSLGFMYGESYPSSRSVYLRYWCRGSSERAQSTRKKKKQSSQFFTKTHIFTQSKFNFRFANHERHSTFLSKENIRLDDFEHLRHFQICRSRPETIAPKV